jgi:hypothetical protein
VDDLTALYDTISKIGFPMLFVFGLFKEWWVMGAQYRFVLTRLAELAGLVETQGADQARTMAIIERQQGLIEQQASVLKVLGEEQALVVAKLDVVISKLDARGG